MIELRNRVYHFATESLYGHVYAPRANHTQNSRLASRNKRAKRAWEYFGLTQACQQLRVEYRPLWIRNLRVRTATHSLTLFVDSSLHDLAELTG